ncbi:MAG: DNA alkylation repair protein [Acholeplasma sp.]|nr:DNA alkylation repair protein [Acholeplasma sp.]
MIFKDIVWKEKNNEFIEYIKSFQNTEEKIVWTKKIINTNMPLLAIQSKELKAIINEVKKTDIIDYLDLQLFDYYELTVIYGTLIMELKDFDEIKKYLNILGNIADNWATCDTIPFKKIRKKFANELFGLAKDYLKSKKSFVRRIGLIILFEYHQDEYLNEVFDLIDMLEKEDHYYVNMANAWLVSHLFIKNRNETLSYLDNHKLNTFTINKAIQKCRDSFRVTPEDKELLLKYKVK